MKRLRLVLVASFALLAVTLVQTRHEVQGSLGGEPSEHGADAERASGAGERGSGIQITPDGLHVLINKDVASERWSITRNLDDLSVTGNVFFPEGGDPLFLFCEEEGEIEGDLLLRCSGADRCSDTSCPSFQLIADVAIPRSFFEPPASASAVAERIEEAVLGAAPGRTTDRRLESPTGLGRGSGIQITPDESRVLVNKDVGDERWSITRNLSDGSVTGNVFFPDGGDPLFLFCEERGRSGVELELRCSGSDRCSDTLCPAFELVGDVSIPESFFEPPSPLVTPPGEDPTPPGMPTPTPNGTPGPGGDTPRPTSTSPIGAPSPAPTSSPGASISPTPVGFPPTPRPTATSAPGATAGPTPGATAAPTPGVTAAPTPGPTGAPTPSPSPSPGPTSSPPPSPAPGSDIFGIPQGMCRNGTVDAGEECDCGAGNLECPGDPEFSQQCATAPSTCSQPCAYCRAMDVPGFPHCGIACPNGTLAVGGYGAVCGTDSNDPPSGDSSLCTLSVGGDSIQGDCGALPGSVRVNVLERRFEIDCFYCACVDVESLRGSCQVGDRDEPCTLDVNGQTLHGVCERIDNRLLCLTDLGLREP